jgi:hypothetical protein
MDIFIACIPQVQLDLCAKIIIDLHNGPRVVLNERCRRSVILRLTGLTIARGY